MIRNILIVDDHISFLEGLSKALSRHCDFKGEVQTVINGESAIEEIGSCFYDICFLDLKLPDIDGMEVMEAIRRISPKTKVVIMTTEYIEVEIREKLERNAAMFIAKPVELDVIRHFIKSEQFSGNHGGNGHYTGRINAQEKRLYARKPYNARVHCSICVFYNWELKSDMEADIIDLSKGGIGIRVDYPVYPGNVLKFDHAMENRTGLVKWSRKEHERYRVGIKFQ